MAGTFVSDTIQDGAGVSTSTTNVIQGCAKAWLNFNGTNLAIRASYNVSSVTRNGTGQYTVNFTNALPNADYSCVGTASNAGANNSVVMQIFVNNITRVVPTTTAFALTTVQALTALVDSDYVCVSIFD